MGGVLAFFFFALAPAFSPAAERSSDSPAFQREWLALHYYVGSWTLGSGAKKWASEIRADEKSSGFFLAPDGSENPGSELLAFRAALAEPLPADPDNDVRCRFPARYAFVKRALDLGGGEAKPFECPRYEKWRKEIDADSAYLLFAAQFMNSPASMYGHTLLQLGRSGKTKGDAILDYVVAYGAETGGAGGLSYIVLGLSGGFPGFFSTVPFYLKIREYNDAESRDLWAYKLRLSPEQLDFLLAHLWEVRTVNFPYYFLGKNCSYFLLRFLDLVNPGEPLVRGLPFWTIPVDTIRALAKRGWITERTHRPSRSARMLARRKFLVGEEKDLARDLVESAGEAPRADFRARAARDPVTRGAARGRASFEPARPRARASRPNRPPARPHLRHLRVAACAPRPARQPLRPRPARRAGDHDDADPLRLALPAFHARRP